MTDPMTSIRWPLAKHIVELMRSDGTLDGVAVEAAWPGDKHLRRDMIWVDEISGTTAIPVGTGGRKHRDDHFEIQFLFRVAGHRTIDATRSRLDELTAALENLLADSPTVMDFDGVVSAEASTGRSTCGETPSDGPLGFGEIVVAVHARLT